MALLPLKIGDIIANIPIIQGGMGVGISLSNLAGAVAAEGGIGVISAAQIGYGEPGFAANSLKANLEALSKHIALAREKARGGVIGVNIMSVTRKYEEYVKCCVENKVDIIISGAGLPLNLPELVKNSATKIAPIVSSVKAAMVLLKLWNKRYNATADAVVIEGPKAGGHLGFKLEQLAEYENGKDYDEEITGILSYIETQEDMFDRKIPVVFGGGVFTASDIRHYMELGCDGVQIASRFVVTEECDAHPHFKQAYLDAKREDIGIVNSPVGMPGRAILNRFAQNHEKRPVKTCYNCMGHCDHVNIPYCISQSLIDAVNGDTQDALVFCGENAYRLNEMTTVKDLMRELTGSL